LAASGTTSSIASFTAVNNGTTIQTATITVRATASGCTSDPKTMRINVNPRPQITVNSPIVCGRDSATLTVTGAANTYTWSPVTAMFPTTGAVVKVAPTTTTTYTVTARFTATGCQNTATGTATVRTKPAITATSANPTTCGGTNGSITLRGLAASTSYILNYAKNGIAITPVTRTSSTSGTILISSLTAGNYTNINVTLNGCVSNTLGPIVLTDACNTPTSIPVITSQQSTLNANESIKIYPNPFNDRLTLTYLLNERPQNVNVKVFNSTGALVKELKNVKTDQLIRTNEWPSGNLILLIETPITKRSFIYKVIKNN
jgi:hypothetical protein